MQFIKKFFYFSVLLAILPQAHAVEALVDTQWVKENLRDTNIIFLDVRSNFKIFKKAHIPGAIFTHYVKDNWRVAGKKRGKKVPGLLPSSGHLEKLISRLGISNDNHIIVVPAGQSPADLGVATRIYWTFKIAGHEQVSVLNGGMAAYIAAKLPLSSKVNVRAPSQFLVKSNYLATESDVVTAIDQKEKIIDSRTPSQYLGFNKSGRAHRAGTLPTAINVPGEYLTVNGGGVFRSKAALKKLYGVLDAPHDQSAVVFCNTGHWASLGWFVHSEILGIASTKMYDGSMAEYTTSEELPLKRKVILDN